MIDLNMKDKPIKKTMYIIDNIKFTFICHEKASNMGENICNIK